MKVFVLLIITTICGLSWAGSLCASHKKDLKNVSITNYANGADPSTNRIHFRIPKDDDIKSEECKDFCFALWKTEKTSNGSKISIILQGCWQQSGEKKCDNKECIAGEQSKALNNTKFCCCTGDYCNLEIKDYTYNKSLQSSRPTISTEYLGHMNSERLILIVIITLVSTVFILFIIILLVYRIYRHSVLTRLDKTEHYTDQFTQNANSRTGPIENLNLSMSIGEGRYGKVYRAKHGDKDVAVKIYKEKSHFEKEKGTYCLPFMEHPSLLHYFGAGERISEGTKEYHLVLSYVPGGTLTDFLRSHTIDWPTFCKMGLTIVRGLAHLHTEVREKDKSDKEKGKVKVKPCIAHRDINSRNILIKADGTCCICDLGLSVQITGSQSQSNSEEHIDVQFCNDVGTIRYMAPEILEGAVNLRDCESSLKQIDVYALGLVLWELVSRCSDIYLPGTEVPSYAQPFEREIGEHPTFEKMQNEVSRKKLRPKLEEGLVVDKPYVRLINETLEDCWDADAEARLTALCIEERLTELQSHQVALYFTNENSKTSSSVRIVPSNEIQTKAENRDSAVSVQFSNETGIHNLVHLSSSNSTDDQSSTSSNEKPVYKPSESLESIDSTQLSLFNERSDSYQRDYTVIPSNVSIASTSKQSLEDDYPPGPGYQTLVNPEIILQNDSPRRRKFAGWSSHFKNILSTKKSHSYSLCQIERDDSKSSLLPNSKIVDTNVTICRGKYVSVVETPSGGGNERPSTLPLKKSKISRQESLDKFNEIFNVDSNLRNLKNPHMRIKTPGDLPPSVRKMRGRSQNTARYSLYDDRIMCNIFSEEDDCAAKSISNSVPFGMDFAECKSKFDADVTCF